MNFLGIRMVEIGFFSHFLNVSSSYMKRDFFEKFTFFGLSDFFRYASRLFVLFFGVKFCA